MISTGWPRLCVSENEMHVHNEDGSIIKYTKSEPAMISPDQEKNMERNGDLK